jgi:hypothetical protein
MKANVNYEVKRALSRVTMCAIYKFTGYIYLMFTQECERLQIMAWLPCVDSRDRYAFSCHYSLLSRPLELMRVSDINCCLAGSLCVQSGQCLTVEDEPGN